MQTLTHVKYIILTLGLFLLFIASVLYYQSQHPFNDSLETQGKIIQVLSSNPTQFDNSSKQSYLVSFNTLKQQEIQLHLQPPTPFTRFNLNQHVKLIYSASEPSKAKLKTYPSLFSDISIWADLGCLFVVFFLTIHLSGFNKQRRIRHLQKHGIEIQTVFRCVECDLDKEARGEKAYRICSEWLNSNATALHIFKSDYLLIDPTERLEDSDITVLIDESNPSEYYLDISFLDSSKREPSFKW